MSHHPSCRPNDRDLVWLCAQCGERESAAELEADTKRLTWIFNFINDNLVEFPGSWREAIDAAMKGEKGEKDEFPNNCFTIHLNPKKK